MPADEMMATITRPDRRGHEGHPRRRGACNRRRAGDRPRSTCSSTGRSTWCSRSSTCRAGCRRSASALPATATTTVQRLTFSAFPIIGISLTSQSRDLTSLWETARYTLKPRFLQIPGVARVDLVGGRAPEFHVVVDPTRLQAAGLALSRGQRCDHPEQRDRAGRHARGEPHAVSGGRRRARADGPGHRRDRGRHRARRADPRAGRRAGGTRSRSPSSTSSPPTASTPCC